MGNFTVCVLLYGPHAYLAERCLGSIASGIRTDAVCEYRLGLNAIGPATGDIVRQFAESVSRPVKIWHMEANACKYPVMRKMLYGDVPIVSPYVMWFDDDSYLHKPQPNWIDKVEELASKSDMVGQYGWRMPLVGNQRLWIMDQPWYNPKAGLPRNDRMEFCQGAWWVAKYESLKQANWPWPELRHNGGDSMLGEYARHADWTITRFDEGVRINADEHGQHSKSKRRGVNERRLGYSYKPGEAIDLAHQNFQFSYYEYTNAVCNKAS